MGRSRHQNFPAEASPSEAVISAALRDWQARIKDSQQACLEEFVDHRGLSEHLIHPDSVALQATGAAFDRSSKPETPRDSPAQQYSVLLINHCSQLAHSPSSRGSRALSGLSFCPPACNLDAGASLGLLVAPSEELEVKNGRCLHGIRRGGPPAGAEFSKERHGGREAPRVLLLRCDLRRAFNLSSSEFSCL